MKFSLYIQLKDTTARRLLQSSDENIGKFVRITSPEFKVLDIPNSGLGISISAILLIVLAFFLL
jgi:hypothetical protein